MDLPLLLGLTFIIGLISVESFVLFWPFWLALLMKFLILSATLPSVRQSDSLWRGLSFVADEIHTVEIDNRLLRLLESKK